MLRVGEMNALEVVKELHFGVYLKADDKEILLPAKYVPRGTRVGQHLNVFIYTDSEDRLIATTIEPQAKVGEHAFLKVKQQTKYGAFLDWGLEKDLFVPFAHMQDHMVEGRSYVVRVLLDESTGRIIGTSKLRQHFQTTDIPLQEGDQIEYIVFDEEVIGYFAVVNDRYGGVFYRNETFGRHHIGQKGTAFVKRVREDGKIDLAEKKPGYAAVVDAQVLVEEKLRKAGGFLPFTDSSAPDAISREFGISKGAFKKALGGLYRRGVIRIDSDGIRLAE